LPTVKLLGEDAGRSVVKYRVDPKKFMVSPRVYLQVYYHHTTAENSYIFIQSTTGNENLEKQY